MLLDYDADTRALDCWLLSHFQTAQWEGPLMTADEKPTRQNSNGLYAAKSPDSDNLPCRADMGDVRIIGRVGMLGKVVEAERGYRAEQMIVRELWIIDRDIYADYDTKIPLARVIQALANRYELEDEQVHVGRP